MGTIGPLPPTLSRPAKSARRRRFRRSVTTPISRSTMPAVQTLRRALLALGAAGLAAVFVRLRGSGGTPPRHGGWRELSPDDFTEG